MKKSILLLLLAIISTMGFSQKQLQFLNQRFEFNAVRHGQPVRMENKDFGLMINYDTGEFFAKINLTESRLFSDEEVEYRIPGDEFLEITGFIPMNDILENDSQTQQYQYELNVKHLNAIVPVVFTFDINKIKNSDSGFNLFNISGTTNLEDFGAEDLKGYEPEITLVLNFQVVVVGD